MIIQGIGFLGVALFVLSYQFRSNRVLFLLQLLGCSVFCLQFFLMGRYTGVISLMVNILRNVLLIRAGVWKWAKSRKTMYGILLLLLVLTAWTWDGWVSLLPMAATAVTTIGYWTHNAQKIRLSQMFGSPCFLIYDVLIGSWGGVLNETITILSILLSIVRFGWKELGEETS